jgi:hypothetical protein
MTSSKTLLRRARTGGGAFRVVLIGGMIPFAVLGGPLVRQPKQLAARSADPTFARDVAPIMYENCTTCHRTGGLAPFSLLEYDSAKSRVDDIKDAVEARYMPPWHADGPRGVFRNDRRLSDGDRETILRWIATGAKPGDMKELPPKPEYPSTWAMGVPDAIISMPEDFTVPASGTLEYQYFEVPTNFTEDKWVQAIEIMPGAREVVHHMLVFARYPAPPAPAIPSPATTPPPATPPPTAAGAPRPGGTPTFQPLFIRPRGLDAPRGPARKDSLHPPPRNMGGMIAGAGPGTNMVEFVKGTALRLRAGTVLTFQMHYTAHGHEMRDRSRIAFRFTKEMPEEEIFSSQFVNGALVLPPGAKDVAVPAEIMATQPTRIWGLVPHTHLRGVRWQYTLVKPDSTSDVVLDVPRYDFNWQTFYLFDKPLEMPAGAKLISTAWYDNSASNKSNPDPSKEVRWGDQTWEEMQFTGFLYSLPGRRVRPPPDN